jgi:predicted GIY-YIG superfamily endonuclease
MRFAVYVLKDPETDAVRYVGYTNDPVCRLRYHCYSERTHKGNWVKSLLRRGFKPVLQVVCWVEDVFAARELEIRLIASLRLKGVALVNGTDGGEGVHGMKHTDEWKVNHSLCMRTNNPSSRPAEKQKKRDLWTLEKKEEFGARISARMADGAHQAKMVEAARKARLGCHHSEESKALMSLKHKAIQQAKRAARCAA